MTTYVPIHTGDRYAPAGQGAIEKLCGMDSTSAFEAGPTLFRCDLCIVHDWLTAHTLAVVRFVRSGNFNY